MKPRAVMVALAIVTTGLVWPASPAAAAELPGTPDADGSYAACNVDTILQARADGDYVSARVACNYGKLDLLPDVFAKRIWWTNPSSYYGTAAALAGDGTYRDAGIGQCNANPAPQAKETVRTSHVELRIEGSNCIAYATGSSVATAAYNATDVEIEYSDGLKRAARISTLTHNGTMPAYPNDYFPGGTANAVPDVDPPQVACGRTLRDMGNGQWFADLDSIETWDLLVGGTRQTFWTILNGDTYAVVHAFSTGGDAKRTWALPADQATWPTAGYVAVRTAAFIPETGHSFDPIGVTPTNGQWYTAGGRWYYAAKAARQAIASTMNVFGVPLTEAQIDEGIVKLTGYEWKRGDGTTDSPPDPTSSTWVYDANEASDVTELVTRCFARLDPREPAKGGGSTTTTDGAPPASADPEDDRQAEDGDDCSILGGASKWARRVPLIGSLASSAINLVGSLGCVLKWLFIPDSLPWSDLWDEAKVKFPFSVGDEIGGALTRIHDAMSANKDTGDACGVIDLRSVMRSGAPDVVGTKVDNVIWRLPTPQESGCPSFRNTPTRDPWENTLGDLLGFREVVRGAAALFLYVGFMLGVIRAFVDDDAKALEPSS